MGAYQLKNEELTLTVISAGAEMKSLKDNKTEQEYLWQADPKFWGRTSPASFPNRRKLCAEAVGIRRKDIYAVTAWFCKRHGI